MAKKIKKSMAAMISAVMAVNVAAAAVFNMAANAADTKYEFEDAEYTSDIEVTSDGLFMKDSGTITLTVEAPSTGPYDITFYAYGSGGDKQQNVSVNGVAQGVLGIPAGTAYVPCVMEAITLKEGANTIAIEKSWGWSYFDYLTIDGATLPPIQATDIICADPDAIPEAQNLMNYMASVYGEHIISGQQEIYQYGPHDLEYEFEYLQNLTGEMPAIRGFDYGNFTCPAFGSDDGSTERVIDWVKNRNGIATSSWHLNVPKDMASYTSGSRIDFSATTFNTNTDFSPSKAIQEGTKENLYYMQALETLAAEFNELEAQGIPIILRPLHEAEGGGGETGSWFWWGIEGSQAYKDLWIYTYDVLTNDFGCHNLIWEWNSYNFDSSANWYPGDDYVDIIGYDKYSCTDWSTGSKVVYHNDSAIPSTFYGIMQKYNSTKMVAMAENDSFSTVDNLINDKAGWLYFCTWYDGSGSADSDSPKFLSDPIFNTEKDTIEMYQSDYCITLDELPATLYSDTPVVTKPIVTTPTTATTTTTEPGPTTKVEGTITEATDGTRITFDEAIGSTLYLEIDASSAVTFANGCVGISATVGGTDYWVSYQWDVAGDETVKIDLSKPSEISYNNGEDKVTDKDLIAEIAAEAMKQNTCLFQKWWTNDAAGEQIDNSEVTLAGAYLEKALGEDPTTTEPEETTTTEITTTTTTVTSEDTTTTTVTTTSTDGSDTTTTTTATTNTPAPNVYFGDTNLDGKLSMVDLVHLNKFVAQLVDFNDNQKLNADCRNDGIVNNADADVLLKYLLSVIDALPIMPD